MLLERKGKNRAVRRKSDRLLAQATSTAAAATGSSPKKPTPWAEHAPTDTMPRGRLIDETNQLGDSQSFRYNNQGDLIAHEDFEGHLYEYDYDEEGRLTQKTFNGQKEARYEYDENGNLLKAVNELTGNELLYSYDRKNNLTVQTTEMGTTRYTFDGRGLKTQEVRPSQIIHYIYDERGSLLISEESLLARQKVSYRYNALGQEVRRDVSGSLIEKRHYNQWGRLLGITGHKVQFDDLVGPLLYGESYTYGPRRSENPQHRSIRTNHQLRI